VTEKMQGFRPRPEWLDKELRAEEGKRARDYRVANLGELARDSLTMRRARDMWDMATFCQMHNGAWEEVPERVRLKWAALYLEAEKFFRGTP
jgi:hypothetical protein